MTLFEFSLAFTMIISLLALRFGIPLLVMAVGRFFCCRVLHLNTA
jgi:hypothetical protein